MKAGERLEGLREGAELSRRDAEAQRREKKNRERKSLPQRL